MIYSEVYEKELITTWIWKVNKTQKAKRKEEKGWRTTYDLNQKVAFGSSERPASPSNDTTCGYVLLRIERCIVKVQQRAQKKMEDRLQRLPRSVCEARRNLKANAVLLMDTWAAAGRTHAVRRKWWAAGSERSRESSLVKWKPLSLWEASPALVSLSKALYLYLPRWC